MRRRKFIAAVGATGVGATGIDESSRRAEATTIAAEGSEIEIVNIERTRSHVYADDSYAVGYGNGFEMAHNRLFQMDVLRNMARGEAAELLDDPDQLSEDMRTKRDLYDEAEIREMWSAAPGDVRTLIQGFTDGVNEKLHRMYDGDGRTLPGEYMEIRDPPDWKPEDSVAIMAFLLGRFGVGGGDELSNAKSFARLERNLGSAEDAFRAYGDLNWLEVPDEHQPSIPRSELEVGGGESVPAFSEVPQSQFEYADAAVGAEAWGQSAASLAEMDDVDESASNALAVGGEHTETGQPMLFGGPQMGMFKPQVLYQVGLHGAGFDVAGVGIVGAPGVVIGRTPSFAWSVTSGRDDHTDTIAIDLDANDRHRYEWNGDWYRMDCDTHVHDVDGTQYEQEICRIEQDGAVMPVVAWNPDENVAWVQRTTTRYDEVYGAYRWIQVGQQSDRAGFRDAISDFPFSFNFLFADEQDIAMYHTGKVPNRDSGVDHRLPRTPSQHDWDGTMQGLDAGIEVVNPDQGYLTSWNNAPVGGWRVGDAEQQWGCVHRNDFLDRLVQDSIADTGSSLSLADVREILWYSASHHTVARFSSPGLVEQGWSSEDDYVVDIAGHLNHWETDTDYQWHDTWSPWYETTTYYSHSGFAIWEEVRKEMHSLLFREHLGDQTPSLDFDPIGHSDPHAADHGRTTQNEVALVDVLEGRTDFDWTGETPLVDVVETAYQRAANTLQDRFGTSDPADWDRQVWKNEFTPIGGQNSSTLYMRNRGSYNHVVALGQGLEGAGSILPPSNDGYLSEGDLTWMELGGAEPDRLTEQLDTYNDFEYVLMPVTRDQVLDDRLYKDSFTLSTG